MAADKGSTLLDQARQQYPILNGANVGFVSTPDANSGDNMLESWPC